MNAERKTILSNETLVPVGMLSIIFGFCMWLTTVWATGQDNSKDISEMKIQRRVDMEELKKEIDKISEKLDRLIERKVK